MTNAKKKVAQPAVKFTDEEIRARITHILTIYPIISPTMLQAGIGPQISPAIWKPVLDNMISEGTIDQEAHNATTPAGRHLVHKRLMLHNRVSQ